MIAASNNSPMRLTTLMLKRKYRLDVNKIDDLGMSALSYCILSKNNKLLKYLMFKREAKAFNNDISHRDYSPFFIAIRQQN